MLEKGKENARKGKQIKKNKNIKFTLIYFFILFFILNQTNN